LVTITSERVSAAKAAARAAMATKTEALCVLCRYQLDERSEGIEMFNDLVLFDVCVTRLAAVLPPATIRNTPP
jgi:hypothetical protein